MKIKKQRLEAIESIVRTETIRNQDDLQKSLTDKGFDVTQATLSRDIRQLKIVKTHDNNGEYRYVLPRVGTPKVDLPTVSISTTTIEFSGNFAVIKTRPGFAMALAAGIDDSTPSEILATIAGDDTILVIPRDGFSKTDIKKALKKFIN